jgi:hypothetical protein
MRVLICGSRNWPNNHLGLDFMNKNIPKETTHIIEGGCSGADIVGQHIALIRDIPYTEYPAEWSKYGRAAGPIRNQQMLDEGKPDLVIAFHDDIEHSKGTKDMVTRARQQGIPVKVITHG